MLVLAATYSQAKSLKAFYSKLQDAGLKIYFRGQQPGVIGKRKYRLKTLGYSLERLQALDYKQHRRQQELKRIMDSQTLHKNIEPNRS